MCPGAGKVHILHVEDSAVARCFVGTVLACDEIALKQVSSLREAAEQLQDCYWDAVALDLMLEDSIGIATLQAVKALCPGMPVVIVSDLHDPNLKLECIREGAVYFCEKRDARALADYLYMAIELQAKLNHCETKARCAGHALTESMMQAADIWAAKVESDPRVAYLDAKVERALAGLKAAMKRGG